MQIQLEKLESHLAVASYDSYTYLMLSNPPHASITQWMHANYEPIIVIIVKLLPENVATGGPLSSEKPKSVSPTGSLPLRRRGK